MLAYCTRTMNAASLQIHFELDEAAYVSGVSMLETFRRIFLPLMAPAIFYSALMVGMLSARDLTLPLVMNTGNSEVVATLIFNLQTNGEQKRRRGGCPLHDLHPRHPGAVRPAHDRDAGNPRPRRRPPRRPVEPAVGLARRPCSSGRIDP